jgi:hypothetical protein
MIREDSFGAAVAIPTFSSSRLDEDELSRNFLELGFKNRFWEGHSCGPSRPGFGLMGWRLQPRRQHPPKMRALL